MKTVTVNTNDANQRIDKFLGKMFKTMPKSLVYKGIRKKRIKVNGKRCDIDYILKVGDKIDLYINDEFFTVPDERLSFLKIKEPSLSVVYEDENIILMDKRPGVIVHDDDSEKINTLLNHMKAYLCTKGEYNPNEENSFVPSLCNRIDRNTGGIVIGKHTLGEGEIKTSEFNRALITWKRGDLSSAIVELEELYEDGYHTSGLYGSLGSFYLINKEYEKALKLAKEGIEFSDTDLISRDNLGQAYIGLGMLDEAEEIYDELLPKEPKFMEPYFNYATVMEKRGNLKEAKEFYENALEYEEKFLSTITHEEIKASIDRIDELML